jgi:hypothetical protein
MGNRSRLFYHARCEIGQTQTIALLETLPFNATLLQFSISLGAVPVTAAQFTITKISRVGPWLNIVIFDENLFVGGITNTLVPCDIEFLFNDQIQAAFANPDDQDVGLELIFREGD